ncbi:DUF2256 domain-containing protein [Flavobacterium sp. J372]
MHKGNKSYLPSKLCTACGREFSWRKKWEKIGMRLSTAVINAEKLNDL